MTSYHPKRTHKGHTRRNGEPKKIETLALRAIKGK